MRSDLLRALGLEDRPSYFQGLLATVRKMVNDTMDINLVYGSQDHDRMTAFRKQIKQQFPDVFEDPALDPVLRQNRMKEINAFARHYFGMQRHIAKKAANDTTRRSGRPRKRKTKGRLSSRTESPSPKSASPSDSALAIANAFLSQPLPRPSPPSGTNSPESNPQPSTTETSLCLYCRNQPEGSQSSSTASQNTSSLLPYKPMYTNLLTGPSASNTMTISSLGGTRMFPSLATAITAPLPPILPPLPILPLPQHRIEEVVDFLQSCIPDMQYLLGSFIGFGCRNRDFLVAVAKSPEDVIDEFLRKMVSRNPPFQGYEVLSEMEVWVLRKHFKRFFSAELGAGDREELE